MTLEPSETTDKPLSMYVISACFVIIQIKHVFIAKNSNFK